MDRRARIAAVAVGVVALIGTSSTTSSGAGGGSGGWAQPGGSTDDGAGPAGEQPATE